MKTRSLFQPEPLLGLGFLKTFLIIEMILGFMKRSEQKYSSSSKEVNKLRFQGQIHH